MIHFKGNEDKETDMKRTMDSAEVKVKGQEGQEENKEAGEGRFFRVGGQEDRRTEG